MGRNLVTKRRFRSPISHRYGEEAGPGYPSWPKARRCYEVGRSIRRFLGSRDERVAVVASSSWLHSFLDHKFGFSAIDLETDRRFLELVRPEKGSKRAKLTFKGLQDSGDNEILNWIIALGILGDIPAEIVDVRKSHNELAYRMAALWG